MSKFIKKESPARYISYTVGFVLSVGLTLGAYLLVVRHALPVQGLIYTIVGLAIVQLAVQLIFFLHLGNEKGPRWKLVSFLLAFIIVFFIVAGSIWIMYNLNYNMIKMTPAQEAKYMQDNEGL